jgi:hypothetical protein
MKKQKIDWINHFIELIVVFIGITLAFMLNNWRESYNNQQLENKYLVGFHNDISDDSAELNTTIKWNEQKLRRVNQFINDLRKGTAQIDSSLIIIGDLVQIHQFLPKLSTFETIKNSGNLNIVTDYNLKDSLIKYYQSFEAKKLQESYYNLYINEYVIPFVYKNVNFLERKIINKNAINNYEFNNLVLGYHQLLTQQIDNYKNIHKMNKELKLLFENKD